MTGEIVAAVFGRDEDIVLVPLPADEASTQAALAADARGLKFCGVMGYIRGESHAKCEPDTDAVLVMMSAVPAFARYVASRVKGLPTEFAVGVASA